MGNSLGSFLLAPYSSINHCDYVSLENIPDHLLLDIFGYLDANDVASCLLVCRRWNYLLNVAPKRLQKYHILRISVDCRFIGQDVVCMKDHRNDGSTLMIHGATKSNTQWKIRRLTCDELRICGPKTEDHSLVAVDAAWLTTVVAFSWKTLSRIYIFRANLFRFTEREISQLAVLTNLTLLSVSNVEQANAFTDAALEPIIRRGTLEKLVLDNTPITDASLFLVAEFCKKLTLLSVWACLGVTEVGVGYIINRRRLAPSNDGTGRIRRNSYPGSNNNTDYLKIICRQTDFDVERFLTEFPQFAYTASGRALEYVQRKMIIHFI